MPVVIRIGQDRGALSVTMMVGWHPTGRSGQEGCENERLRASDGPPVHVVSMVQRPRGVKPSAQHPPASNFARIAGRST